jgi:tetratricopeptide (TPR) repeat protein
MRRLVVWLGLTLVLATPALGQAIRLMTRDLAKVQALAREDSNDAEIHYYLALAFWQRHKWPQVDSALRLAISLDPRFSEAYLALYYLPYVRRPSLGREEDRGAVGEAWRPVLEEAHRFYQRAFRINPLVDLRLYSVIYEIEEPRVNDYTTSEYLEYEMYYAWFVDFGLSRYASAYDRLKRLAEREFAESKHPDKVPDFLLWYRGLAAAHSQRYDAAMADIQTLLDRTLKKQERDEVVHVPMRDNEYRFMLAALNHVTGHADRAVALYREALEHDLGLSMAHTYLAVIYETAGMADSGLVERQRAAEAGEDDPAALFDYAGALFNAQRTAEAEEPLRRAAALNPRYAPTFYLLGRVNEELGRVPEARTAYTQFLAVASQRLGDLMTDARQHLAALPK